MTDHNDTGATARPSLTEMQFEILEECAGIRSPRLWGAIAALNCARSGLREVLKDVQAACKHPKIAHSNWSSSEWGPPFKARRLCLCCGMEEEARNSGWGDSDRDFPNLKSGGFHKVVSRDVIYQNRFPEVEPDTPQ